MSLLQNPLLIPDDVGLVLGSQRNVGIVLDSSTLAANTALTGYLVGTPVTPVALAADSLIIANRSASGDILVAGNKGGTSYMAFMVDASTGDTLIGVPTGQSIDFYIAGAKQIDYATGALAFQQATTISTTATTLTLSPATDTLFANNTGVVVGHTAQVNVGGLAELQVLGTANDTDSAMVVGLFATTAAIEPTLKFLKSAHGTLGSNTTVVTGELLGSIRWNAADATDFNTIAGLIRVVANGTIGTNRVPADMVFALDPGGADDAVAEVWRMTGPGALTSLAARPTNVAAAGVVVAEGGLAFTDVANAWIDDATHGTGTVTHYIGNNTIDVTVSSIAWKKNVLPVNGAARHHLEAFAGLLREYDYKGGEGHFVGMIAEDVRGVLPQYVVGQKDSPSLKYNYMVGPLLWGWQDHEERLRALEARG